MLHRQKSDSNGHWISHHKNWIDHMQSLGFSFLDCPGYCSGFCVFLPTEVVGFSLIASCGRFNDEQTKGAQ